MSPRRILGPASLCSNSKEGCTQQVNDGPQGTCPCQCISTSFTHVPRESINNKPSMDLKGELFLWLWKTKKTFWERPTIRPGCIHASISMFSQCCYLILVQLCRQPITPLDLPPMLQKPLWIKDAPFYMDSFGGSFYQGFYCKLLYC